LTGIFAPLRLCARLTGIVVALQEIDRNLCAFAPLREVDRNLCSFSGEACMTENEVAKQVVDAAYRVHVALGPGLLESVYETVMEYELRKRGLIVECQCPLPVVYEDVVLEAGFRADMIVQGKVIVELKSVEQIASIHYKQVLTYLRMADMRLGLLINFGAEWMKDGIRRVVNGLEE
jgi:GxxExxY protein